MLPRTPEAGEGSGSVNRMQEYLTGLSEQYSAFQTLMGQQAAIQQLQVTIIIIIVISITITITSFTSTNIKLKQILRFNLHQTT